MSKFRPKPASGILDRAGRPVPAPEPNEQDLADLAYVLSNRQVNVDVIELNDTFLVRLFGVMPKSELIEPFFITTSEIALDFFERGAKACAVANQLNRARTELQQEKAKNSAPTSDAPVPADVPVPTAAPVPAATDSTTPSAEPTSEA